MANKDEFDGVHFPQDYNGLLRRTKDIMLINRRLAAMVGNQYLFIQAVLDAHADEDALKLHRMLDEYKASVVMANAVLKAQASTGMNVQFPTVQ